MGKTTDEQYPGLIVVGTVTPGFESQVLGPFGKNDRDVAGNRLRERNEPTQAARAEAGMRALERDTTLLQPPDSDELRETLEKLRQLYEHAYEWATPAPAIRSDGTTLQNTIRYRIRACINEWDLRRFYPDAQPETEGQGFEYGYEEMPEMEQEVKDDD